ncbi:MAG: hypothetical protein ABIO70_06105 [Pseudomonadota bacterium]
METKLRPETANEWAARLGGVPVYNTLVLIGAEGVAELGEQPWLREASAEELAQARRIRDGVDMEKPTSLDERFDALFLDHNGRPYWAMMITPEAPAGLWRTASSTLRCVHLEVSRSDHEDMIGEGCTADDPCFIAGCVRCATFPSGTGG